MRLHSGFTPAAFWQFLLRPSAVSVARGWHSGNARLKRGVRSICITVALGSMCYVPAFWMLLWAADSFGSVGVCSAVLCAGYVRGMCGVCAGYVRVPCGCNLAIPAASQHVPVPRGRNRGNALRMRSDCLLGAFWLVFCWRSGREAATDRVAYVA